MRCLFPAISVFILVSCAAALKKCHHRCPNNDFYCDVNNAQKFYLCFGGRKLQIATCPDQLLFNPSFKTCDLAERVGKLPPCGCGERLENRRTTRKTKDWWITSEPPTVATTTKEIIPQIRVCYYTNWSQYRKGPDLRMKMSLELLKEFPEMCTHIIVAFLELVETYIAGREWNDYHFIADLLEFREYYNPDLKLSVAIGGWNAGTEIFNDILISPKKQKEFALNAAWFLDKYKLDGLDVDMEYPGDAQRASPPEARSQFTQWLETIRNVFDDEENIAIFGKRFLLTAAVGVTDQKIAESYEVAKISKSLDYIYLMVYDLAGGWLPYSAHQSPMRTTRRLPSEQQRFNVIDVVDAWLAAGAPREKLVLGISFYGRSVKLTLRSDNGMGAPIHGPGDRALWTQGDGGFLAFPEACLYLRCGFFHRVYDDEQKVPYMVKKVGNLWIGYDDVQSVWDKTNYAMDMRLAGVMIWSIDLDDITDVCETGGAFPLMRAVVAAQQGLPPPILDMSINETIWYCDSIYLSMEP